MAKKNKSSPSRRQPNAPEFQQIFYQPSQQPPVNPYYPDPTSASTTYQPPPPYSSSQGPVTRSPAAIYQPVPMSQMNDINYPRISQGQATPIVIQASSTFDYRGERRKRQVAQFNTKAIIIAMLAIATSLYAYNLYKSRPCVESFVVAKESKDLEIKISDVRNAHIFVAYLSAGLFVLCILKSSIGYHGESNFCYLLLVSLITFYLAVHTAVLAYFAFYSPCVPSFEEIGANVLKTIASKFIDSIPSPDKRFFNESNVFDYAKQDTNGLIIFLLDVVNFVLYFSVWLGSITNC